MEKGKKIMLFDGVCNLCNGAVMFIIKRDKHDTSRFGALQSNTGMELVEKNGIDMSKTDSIILIDDNGKLYTKSLVAHKIAPHLWGVTRCYMDL